MRRILFLTLLLLFVIPVIADNKAYVDPAVDAALKDGGKATVIITLKSDPTTFVSAIAAQAPEARKEKIKQRQEKLLARLQKKAAMGAAGTEGADGSVARQLENVPVITAKIGAKALSVLASSPDVESIYLSTKYKLALATTVGVVRADALWSKSIANTTVTGEGQSICVIDTGVDASHASLAAKVVNQKCYCSVGGGCCQGGVESDNATDDNGHGTHVASIAAASGNITGVAKGASIVAVKVCNSGGSCDLADMVLAMDYCINQSSAYNISVITMSISDGGSYAAQPDCPTSLDAAISTAAASNMVVTVASGNEGSTTGIGYPGCSPNATSVGATVHDGSSIASYSNRGPLLDVVAPGSSVVAARSGSICSAGCVCSGSTQTCSGTSMATPHVAGVAALLAQQARLLNRSFSPSVVEQYLKETSAGIAGYRRTDAFAAAFKQVTNYTYNNTNTSVTGAFGTIQFRQTLNLSHADECFNITQNNVSLVDSATCSPFNLSATVRINNVQFASAKPLVNGLPCSDADCQNRSFENSMLQFDVLHFSSYTATSALNLTVNDTTDVEARFVGEQIMFSANFTNGTGAANTTDGACTIQLNTTGVLGTAVNMTSVSGLYQYNASFANGFTGTYNVSCASLGEQFNVIDAFVVSNDTTAPSVTLSSPANGGTATTGSVTFSYVAQDNTSIQNCSITVDGTVSGTDTAVTSGATETFAVTVADGSHAWNVSCSDAWQSGVSGTFTFTSSTPAPSSSGGGGGGGGGGGCVDTCKPAGFLYCAGSAELQCGQFDSDACLETGIKDCDAGYSCMPGLGCQKNVCYEEWQCEDWSPCTDGTQTRACIDLFECGTEDAKPVTTQACTARVAETAAVETPPSVETFKVTSAVQAETDTASAPAETLVRLKRPIIAVLIVVMGAFLFVRLRKKTIVP